MRRRWEHPLERIHLIYLLSVALFGMAAWNVALKLSVDEGERQRGEIRQEQKALEAEAGVIRKELAQAREALARIEGHLGVPKGVPK